MARGKSYGHEGKRGSFDASGKRKVATTFNPKYQANLARQNSIVPRPGGSNIDWGGAAGMFSNRDPGRFPEGDLAYHEGLRKDVWQKTTPDLNYIGGSNKWTQNPDGTWALTAELDDDYTKIREDAIRRQGMFGQQAEDLASGGWRDAQKSRYGDMMGIYEEELAVADQLRRAREVNTGASSTTRFMNQRDADASTNRLKLGAMNQAFQESQGLIDNNLLRSTGQYDMLTGIANEGNQFLANQMQNADATANLAGVGDASTRKWDTLAAFEEEKAKSKNKFIGNILEWGGNMLMPGAGTTAKSLLYG
jgi:hypothetical protein